MIFPLYILVQIVLWFVSGGKWPWLLKSTEIFMILSSADSYIAADIIGVFDRFLSDLVRGVFYPNRRNFIRIRIRETQDKILRTVTLAIITLLIDAFLV